MKALFKLKADLGTFFRSDIALTMKLFDSLIKPILLYGSEIWGADNKNETKDNDPLEQVHIKFCKMVLGTSKTSVNNACRGELGRYPIELFSTYRSIKYWSDILTKEPSMLSKMAYHDSLVDLKEGFWSAKIRDKIFCHGFGFTWISCNEISAKPFLKNFKQRLKDILYQK